MRTSADSFAGTAPAALTTLTAHVPGTSEDRSWLVQRGMTIGRDPDNAIVVDHCDVCAVHAAIYQPDDSDALRIECVQQGFRLRNEDGKDIDGWPLNFGLVFWIGAVKFTCSGIALGALESDIATQRDEPRQVLPYVPILRESCPRCRESIHRLPNDARFCPHCGLELPEHCPPWLIDGELTLTSPALAAYAHAMFNLGVRFELASHKADVEQAMRYYEKAARIGVMAARARLECRVGDGAAALGSRT